MAGKATRKRSKAGAPARQTPLVLRWLKIHQLRHVEPCELRFNDTYNVLLGLNGTGKTTLLELISAALRFNFARMKREAFFIEYEIGGPQGTVVAKIRNEATLAGGLPRSQPSYRISADLSISNVAGTERVDLRITEAGTEIEFDGKTIKEEGLRSDSLHKSTWFAWMCGYLAAHTKDVTAWMIQVVVAWTRVRRFDEALGFFRVITGSSTRINVDTYGKPSIWSTSTSTSGPVPGSILEEVERQSQAWSRGMRTDPVITMTGEQVPLLAQIAKMLGFRSVELRLSHLKTEVTELADSRTFGELRFMLERHDGSVISHDLLSYGQKRALSLLYYLAVNERTVIADELVDGLHHLWIEEAILAIGDRQAFLASQNPLLLDYLEFDSAEKVRQSFVQCRLKKDKKGEKMVWSNLSEYDAERFFDAYQVGLQHVSEILRTKGLW